MKMRYLAALPLIFLAAPAFAADAVVEMDPTPIADPVFSWTGGYIGLQAGYAFGESSNITITPLTGTLATAFSPGTNAGGLLVPDAGLTSDFDDGFVGGVHAGYDYQMNSIVVGGVVDVSYADIGDFKRGRSRTPANYDFTRELDYLVTARARLGYTFTPRVLGYVTGGLAYGDMSSSYSDTSSATINSITEDDDDFGYTVGGGVEAMVTERVSIGLEYLYTNLGESGVTTNLTGPPPANPFGTGAGTDLSGRDDFDFHTVQLRMSYRF